MIVPNHRPERKRATLRELSEITGLSTAGVSYALRGQRVSPATERRVRAAADRIGFRSDPIARALRGGRTELVGVVGGSLADLWHQQFVTSLQGSLRRHGLRMVLADAGRRRAGGAGPGTGPGRPALRRPDRAADRSQRPGLAGDRRRHTHGLGERLAARAGRIDPVQLTAPASPSRSITCRAWDTATSWCWAAGRTPHHAGSGVRRVRCGFADDQARDAAARVLAGTRPPTAVFALSDSIACGAYQACRDAGLRVGGDISVVGFDDIPISRLLDPALTAVGWDTPGAAVGAAQMLVDAIAGRPAGEMVIEPRLHVRSSTAPAPL